MEYHVLVSGRRHIAPGRSIMTSALVVGAARVVMHGAQPGLLGRRLEWLGEPHVSGPPLTHMPRHARLQTACPYFRRSSRTTWRPSSNRPRSAPAPACWPAEPPRACGPAAPSRPHGAGRGYWAGPLDDNLVATHVSWRSITSRRSTTSSVTPPRRCCMRGHQVIAAGHRSFMMPRSRGCRLAVRTR